MQVAAVQYSAQKLFHSAWSNLGKSMMADPVEAVRLRTKSRQESIMAAKLLQVANENDKHVLDMVA
jgi:hypothetical protein